MQKEEESQPCPHSSCVLSCLKGFSSGFTFAVNVRFTHALVIALLFRSGSLVDKLKYIVQLSFEHASRLGCYVAGFKALQCVLARVEGKRRPVHALVAGLLAGFVFFGKKTPITSQMALYLLGRVVAGCVKLALRPLKLPRSVNGLLFLPFCAVSGLHDASFQPKSASAAALPSLLLPPHLPPKRHLEVCIRLRPFRLDYGLLPKVLALVLHFD